MRALAALALGGALAGCMDDGSAESASIPNPPAPVMRPDSPPTASGNGAPPTFPNPNGGPRITLGAQGHASPTRPLPAKP